MSFHFKTTPLTYTFTHTHTPLRSQFQNVSMLVTFYDH